MFDKTKQALALQLFNKPYVDGTKVPFQESDNPRFIQSLGKWIAETARKPVKGKWVLAWIIVYAGVFITLYLIKGYKHIRWKPLALVVVTYVVLLTLFENFAISEGYWGYPDVILKYIYQLPFIGRLSKIIGNVPVSSPLFVYPVAYIAAVYIFAAFINYSWKHNRFHGLKQPAAALVFDRQLFKNILKSRLFIVSFSMMVLVYILFLRDAFGFKTEIGYMIILVDMTFLWLSLIAIEYQFRKKYYGFVEKSYYRIYIKANLLTSTVSTIVEVIGLYTFLVWIINPEKSLIYYLYQRTGLHIFKTLYDFFGISSLEEFYYYVICTLLGITTYNVFYFLIYKRDLLYEWQKKSTHK